MAAGKIPQRNFAGKKARGRNQGAGRHLYQETKRRLAERPAGWENALRHPRLAQRQYAILAGPDPSQTGRALLVEIVILAGRTFPGLFWRKRPVSAGDHLEKLIRSVP